MSFPWFLLPLQDLGLYPVSQCQVSAGLLLLGWMWVCVWWGVVLPRLVLSHFWAVCLSVCQSAHLKLPSANRNLQFAIWLPPSFPTHAVL